MIRLFTIALLAVVGLAACNTGTLYHENSPITDHVWDREDVKQFTVPIADTVGVYNIYLQVRNADGYPFSNLFLFIETEMPGPILRTDTVECILADHTGRWLGDGLGDIWDNSILYRKGIRFPRAGNYTFSIKHGMRQEKLPLIMDIGIAVRKP